MNKDWIYYGVFFSDNTKRAIYDYVSKFLSENGYSIPEDWKKYCDHMTLVFMRCFLDRPLVFVQLV